MTDQVLLMAGHSPWQPSPSTQLVEVYNRHDRPLSGLLQQGGHHYIFWCIYGHLTDQNIWGYSLLEESDVAALTDDESFDNAFDALTERPQWIALANNGRILVASEFDSFQIHGQEDLVSAARERFNRLVLEASEAWSRIESAPTDVAVQAAAPTIDVVRDPDGSVGGGVLTLVQR